MKSKNNAQLRKFHSPDLAVALKGEVPHITYLGIESGGRSCRHSDRNLLKPGFGGEILPGAELIFLEEIEGNLLYAGAAALSRVSFPNERTLKIALQAKSGALPGPLLRISFAPDITPPSFCPWGRRQGLEM